MGAFAVGDLALKQLASDEIQVLALGGVAISSALVGSFLLLRRMIMLANSLSHTILVGIVLAFFLSSLKGQSGASMGLLLISALACSFFTVFLTEFLVKKARLQEDASTGLVFTTLFALGIILVTILTRNAHIGTEAVMGNADALHRSDLFWIAIVACCNALLIALFYKEYLLTTFDPGLASAIGISPLVFNYFLMGQVSFTTITSFRAVGVLLVLAFMTGPPLAARLWTNRLGWMLAAACAFGLAASLFGVALTRHILTTHGVALSTAGVVVCAILALYLAALAAYFLRRLAR